MIFRGEPNMVKGLVLAGIDVVSTANNHARDCGRYGVGFNLALLKKNSIKAAGSGEDGQAAHDGAIVERRGTRFGILAYTYDRNNGNWPDEDDRIALMDVGAMREDVRRMQAESDAVIVSMHAGTEYSGKPNAQQIEFARAAIDAGSKLVVGHHPHVVQPVEEYAGGVIFYSLGNLVFDQYQRKETQQGAVAEVEFAGGAVDRYRMLPVAADRAGTRFLPG
jgi:gamma-polyglutamate biosynthesis protein CapA